MKLIEYLSELDCERIAVSSPSQRIKYSSILNRALRYSVKLCGKRVAYCSDDIVEAIILMVAMDGYGGMLVLVPASSNIQESSDLIQKAGVDFVISDNVSKLKQLVSSPVFSTISEAVDSFFCGKIDCDPEQDTDWLICTSGTTGRPKLVRHTFHSLTKTTKFNKDSGKDQVWGLMYGFSRFAGLQVVFQSVLSGAELIVPDYSISLGDQLSMLSAHHCTHLSATPTMWRKILMLPQSNELSLHQITLGGEIADEKILAGLLAKFPDSYVTHIYASTEAGAGFSVKDGKPGFPIEFLKRSPSNIDLKVIDGRLWINNESVGDVYVGESESVSHKGWVDTRDNVCVTHDRVYFLGRDSGVINVGGNKVHPEVVENIILSHPLVEMVQVYAKKSPIMGELVAADIMITDSNASEKSVVNDVRKHISNMLERYMMPVVINVVKDFNTNMSGKLVRN